MNHDHPGYQSFRDLFSPTAALEKSFLFPYPPASTWPFSPHGAPPLLMLQPRTQILVAADDLFSILAKVSCFMPSTLQPIFSVPQSFCVKRILLPPSPRPRDTIRVTSSPFFHTDPVFSPFRAPWVDNRRTSSRFSYSQDAHKLPSSGSRFFSANSLTGIGHFSVPSRFAVGFWSAQNRLVSFVPRPVLDIWSSGGREVFFESQNRLAWWPYPPTTFFSRTGFLFLFPVGKIFPSVLVRLFPYRPAP